LTWFLGDAGGWKFTKKTAEESPQKSVDNTPRTFVQWSLFCFSREKARGRAMNEAQADEQIKAKIGAIIFEAVERRKNRSGLNGRINRLIKTSPEGARLVAVALASKETLTLQRLKVELPNDWPVAWGLVKALVEWKLVERVDGTNYCAVLRVFKPWARARGLIDE